MSGRDEHTSAEREVRQAIIEGRQVDLRGLGGERAIASQAVALARSRVFGDVVEALVAEWASLSDRKAALAFMADGIRANESPDTLYHALNALAGVPAPELRSLVLALDARVRNGASSHLIRAEAAAALFRLGLADDRWQAAAIASIHALEDVNDEYAGPMVCRLASLAYEQFRDQGALELLEMFSEAPGTASQASFERGLIQFADALDAPDLPSISTGLRHAQVWLRRACDLTEDRRDARAFLLLTEVLVPIAEGRNLDDNGLLERLREEVTLHVMWDRPAPGAEWLLPPHGAELEWLPLADDLARIAPRLTEASWLDAGRILQDVVNVYSATRSVRPDLERVVRPAIEAAFVRERGLLAHLDQWLSYDGKDRLDSDEVMVLRANIRRAVEAPPGKSLGAAQTGARTSSRKLQPG